METKERRPRGRPRKRKRPEDENTGDMKSNIARDKRRDIIVETKPIPLVGRYVLKEFDGNGVYLGKVVFYDTGLYRVDYEDGDCEDLDSRELRGILLCENDFDVDLIKRRKKLDDFLLKKKLKNEKDGLCVRDEDSRTEVERVEMSTFSELSGGFKVADEGKQIEDDLDSSSDSCEHVLETDAGFEAETPLFPPLQLPPSSGTIGVPEEYVSNLLAVYGFLRSFGIHLFLSPFGLDDFVGSLNCGASNTLLDAIHVALMRALRRHLEKLSSDGSGPASNCLRYLDWSLLDALTWPVYVVHYLTLMGYPKVLEWKGFYNEVLTREYYSLSAGRKLMVLQILCDDLLDSVDIRAEMDIREESEVGVDPDSAATNALGNFPRRVHPRYSKTSACKDRDTVEMTGRSDVMKFKSRPVGFRHPDGKIDGSDVDLDGNGDECRICGMDGTLLCCDGCPSAYHTRCIGVNKMSIPEGSWYCPECTINKMGPAIMKGMSLRGAKVLGIDVYGRVFLGTCNHLLVLNASSNGEPYNRYYSANDILKVVRVLLSSVQHMPLYVGICKAILQYWGIPESIISPLQIIKINNNVTNMNTDEKISRLSFQPPSEEFQKFTNMVEAENASSNNESKLDSVVVSSSYSSVDAMVSNDPSVHCNGLKVTEEAQDSIALNSKLQERIKMESAVSTSSISQQADPSDITNQSIIDNLSGHASTCLPANMFSQSKDGSYGAFGKTELKPAVNCVYKGALFKPQAYINQYMHGEFAASAAANLAVLLSEEGQASELVKAANGRMVSGNISLQAKAFSSTAPRFFWPCSEKKLWEVPRERCSWCYSCKGSPSNRRGCMLNSAISVATKNAMKILNGLHPPKIGVGSLSTIATYILYMEESLRGLIGGPFLNAAYRRKWRKEVEKAFTLSSIKTLLLELEENICRIACSGGWLKLLDDRAGDSSLIQGALGSSGTIQKRGPSGRRGRKQSSVSDVAADDSGDQSFSWWQGGKLTKYVSQKAILPCSMIRRAACQGGVRKMPGINYSDGSEIPKRSRQLVWRAAVEGSKNASQLALQVRYLDLHVRWSDLVRPEQNLQDPKGSETEASAFRNAKIFDKKIVDNKIRYGVFFGNQKHLPSRVMKNIIEAEQSQDGKEKYWFSETRIPLYLIKEYEEKMDKVVAQSVQKTSNELSAMQKKQLKASRKDIFSYLVCKRDKSEKCACAACNLDVIIGNAVNCSACQGYCHQGCMINSTCKQCYFSKVLVPSQIRSESPTSPLPSHQRECQTSLTATKGMRPKVSSQLLVSAVRTPQSCPQMKQTPDSNLATKTRNRTLSWGIIWRKKQSEDSGVDFRRANILLRHSTDVQGRNPVCDLCQQPYNSDLMYIHCETCKKWFHAEAVELEESKLSDVVGFKCCKCRRIGGPECPYMDPELREQKRKKRRLRAQKQGQGTVKVGSGAAISEPKESKLTAPIYPAEEMLGPEDDPLLFVPSVVEPVADHNPEVEFEWNNASGPGPQKLQVRRQVKCEGDAGGNFAENDFSYFDPSVGFETINVANQKEEPSVSCAQWDASASGLEGEMMFDYGALSYEDMEFEPQTYFSFSELLPSDDAAQLDGIDASGTVSGNPEDLNYLMSQSQDEIPEHCVMADSNSQAEPMISAVNKRPCQMCSEIEPTPNLLCQICGFLIHTPCSPWDESSCVEGSWRCGNCREWQ